MTNPESITVSLEMAKKLRWEKDTYFYFTEDGVLHSISEHRSREKWESKGMETYSAPTAECILRELPELVFTQGSKCHLKINHIGRGTFFLNIKRKNTTIMTEEGRVRLPKSVWSTDNDTLANAAASMWIYLKGNDLLPSSL